LHPPPPIILCFFLFNLLFFFHNSIGQLITSLFHIFFLTNRCFPSFLALVGPSTSFVSESFSHVFFCFHPSLSWFRAILNSHKLFHTCCFNMSPSNVFFVLVLFM
jgi:hypothetical protein